MKRTIPLIIVITLGFTFVGYAFSQHPFFQQHIFDWYMSWVRAMSPFAMILAIMSLTLAHSTRIQRRIPNWQYSVVTLVGMVFTGASGFIWGRHSGTPYMWMFENVQMPMAATMFALLAFYIASAAYKAFRARSAEATVLLITAIVVMLGQVPVGVQMFGEGIIDITQWILDVPNLAAKRGIALGVGLGSVAVSLRILLGIERTYLGGGE
jgi:hypothetical protein